MTDPLRRVRVHYRVRIPGLNYATPASCVCLLEPGETAEKDIPAMIGIRLDVPASAVEVAEVTDV